jgi:hypothetical protein
MSPRLSLDKAIHLTSSLSPDLQPIAQKEFELLRKLNRNIKVQIHPSGFVVYSLKKSNFVFTTVHNGTYAPPEIPFLYSPKSRAKEEDLYSFELYLPIFLKLGGIFINTWVSRYFVDLNRPKDKAILSYTKSGQKQNYKSFPHFSAVNKLAKEYYLDFYSTLKKYLNKKTILFDGHTMRATNLDNTKRPNICLMFNYLSEGLQLKKYIEKNFTNVGINDPFHFGLHKVDGSGHLVMFAEKIGVKKAFAFETSKVLYLKYDMFHKSNLFKTTSNNISKALTKYLTTL